MTEDYFLQVNKPGRYIGGEWNSSRKDFSGANIKFALCFPDLYEVGMSNLGLRILYGILNGIKDVACERFFSCNDDLENILRSNNLPIFSLESKRGLSEFDLVGFSLGSELDYTNVLNMLELGVIPLEASLRDHTYPLVIGGGPCALNPEPMHEFFDLFVIGEAEDVILEIVDVYRKHKEAYKSGRITRQDLLSELCRIEGVYVPAFYEVNYAAQNGQILEFEPKIKDAPKKIRKRFVKDLDAAFFPCTWILPYIQIVHDRITLEIMRGCPNRCRFCQARSAYFPFRQRKLDNVLDLAKEAYRNTGYEEISLCGLSVSDYYKITELSQELTDLFKKKGVSLSLPSIKARELVGNLSSIIASVKKTGLTFAPEAGTEELRQTLGKDFNEGEFFAALEKAYSFGYQHVKLYFMIGLPQETKEDLDGIIDFSTEVSELKRKVNKAPAQVNISINTLIPKPHTSFQWFGMNTPDQIKDKQDYLKGKAKNRRLKLDFHNHKMSFLEGVLSRGDRRLSKAILAAFKSGAKFDAWADHFIFEKWHEAFRHTGIDPQYYLSKKHPEEILPWDFIDPGVNKEELLSELK